MQQQHNTFNKNFIPNQYTRNTNVVFPTSFHLVSSDWAQFLRNQHMPTLNHHYHVIPSFLSVGSKDLSQNAFISDDGMVDHSNHRDTTSPGTYTLQPQGNQVNRTSHEIKESPTIERSESFITGGNPHLVDLWREINSFDYEAFVESIEGNNNVKVDVSNNVMFVTSPEHESVNKDNKDEDRFPEDFKVVINCKDENLNEKSIPSAIVESPPPQNPSLPSLPSLPDALSTESSDPSQHVSSNDSNRIVHSPSTSPKSSPHLHSKPLDKYLPSHKCPVPYCSKEYHGHNGKDLLKKTGKGKTMVQCTKCLKYFVSRCYLKKHRYLCHGIIKKERWFTCEYCQKLYVTDCERKKHYAKDHSDKIKELWEQQWISSKSY